MEVRIVRVMPADLAKITRLFAEQVYSDQPEAAVEHFDGHAEGLADTFLAYAGNDLAGYVTIRWKSDNPLFFENNIPLIHHLEVLPQFQGQGLASQLMDAAEQLIATRSNKAGITVGLFDSYGPAQRLYAKRGYVPDGRGVCLGQRPVKLGETLTINHDLILWLTKELTDSPSQ